MVFAWSARACVYFFSPPGYKLSVAQRDTDHTAQQSTKTESCIDCGAHLVNVRVLLLVHTFESDAKSADPESVRSRDTGSSCLARPKEPQGKIGTGCESTLLKIQIVGSAASSLLLRDFPFVLRNVTNPWWSPDFFRVRKTFAGPPPLCFFFLPSGVLLCPRVP